MANSDSFSSAVSGTTRNKLATVSAITSASASSGVLQVVTDSGTNLQYFASIPLQTSAIGSKSPIDINSNAAVLAGDFGRPGQDYRGAAPFFSSSSFDGHPFVIQLQGRYTVGTLAVTAAPTITVYQATAAQMATALAAGLSGNAALVSAAKSVFTVAGATTAATGTYEFLTNATLFWDSTAAIVGGEYWGIHYGPAYNTTPTYTTRSYATGLSVSAYSDLNFFATLSFTGATSVVGVTPTEFSISAV
jgi:hypothetical protein